MALEYLTENAASLASGSWILAGGGGGSGFVAGATLIIDRTTAQAINVSVDQSAIAQVDYLKVGRGFAGTMGSAASPVKFGANSTATNSKGFFNDSTGTVYIQAANIAGGGSANTIGYYSKSGTGKDYLIGGAFTTIDIGAGYLELGQGCTTTTVNIAGGETFIDSGTAGTTLNIFWGKVTTKRGFTTINIYGGTLIYDSTATITTGTLVKGGFWDHRNGDVSTAILAGAFTVQNLNRSCTIGGAGAGALITTSSANINRTTSSTVSATFSNEVKVAGGPVTGFSGSPD